MQRNILFLLMLAFTTLQAENALQIIPSKVIDGTGSLAVQIISESSMSACQMDISLPNGLVLGTPTVGSNANQNHIVLSKDLGVSANYEGYHTYRLLLYASDNSEFEAQTGQVVTLPVTGSLTDGAYSVYVDNAILDNAKPQSLHNAVTLTSQGSYLTAGNPNIQDVKLDGTVPSFVITAINTDATVTSVDLTKNPTLAATLSPANPNAVILTNSLQGYTNEVVNGECTSFTLTDGYAFHTPSDFTATSASYSRTGQTYQWGTMCLPYAVSSNMDIQYYTLAKSEGSTLTFKKVDEVPAGNPTLYKILSEADTQGKYAFTAQNAQSDVTMSGLVDELPEVGAWSMHGLYEKRSGVNGIYYISKNQFWYATKAVTITPFRAWFEYSGSNVSETRFSIEEAMGNNIEIIEDEQDASIQIRFDLSGRTTSPSQKSVLIMNHKKILQQ